MKQQTKVITVAAAAVVLSLGASMSSFAATGWTEEDGVWYYYDKDGVKEEDENLDYWFYFKSNGQKQANDSADKDIYEKKVNGRYYGFDQRGVMVYEWALSTLSNAASTSNWRYFNSSEDGARATRGWFKVVAPDENGNDNTYRDYTGTASSNGNSTFAQGDASDETERWYYADKDGQLYAGEIKKISGKYYGFAPEGSDKAGSMLSGLCALTVRNNGEIEKLWVRDMSYDDLQDCMDGVGDFTGFGDDPADALYYFGNNEDSDGVMKTGAVTINLDGDNYQFQFSKSGGAEGRGRGLNGIDSGKYIYKFGQKMKADTDEKYKVIYADADTGSGSAFVHQIDSQALRSGAVSADQKNKDGDTIRYFGTLDSNYYLVNTSGSIVKNKTAAKDGDDWYFYVDNNQIKMYVNSKTLTASDGDITDGTHILKDEWDTAGVEIANGYTGEPDNSMID